MPGSARDDFARTSPLELLGVLVVTIAGGLGVYAFIYGLGSGDAMSPRSASVALLLAMSTAMMWRVGPARIEPLVIGLLLSAFAAVLVDAPVFAWLLGILAAATTARRLARAMHDRDTAAAV